MNKRKLIAGAVVLVVVAVTAWLGWRWRTTPAVPAYNLTGVSKEGAERIEQARARVRDDPRSGEAWGNLGITLIANGFMEESIPCFAYAQRFDPEQPRWPYFQGGMMLMYGRRDGFTKLREALDAARIPKDRAAVLFPLAQSLIEDGQLEEAERRANELRAVSGDVAEVDYVFGLLALNRGQRELARTHLDKLTENPAARKRACALLAGLADDPARAEKYRAQAAALPDDGPWPNSFENEMRAYRAVAAHRMAPYYEMQAQGRYDEALAFLQSAAAQAPDEAVCFTLGSELMKRNRYDEAEPELRRAVGFNPRSAQAHHALGTCLLKMGEKKAGEPGGKVRADELFRQAAEAEEKAATFQNDLTDVHLTRGRALKRLGRTDQAIAAFRQAVLVGTEYAEPHQVLGEALCEAGRVKDGLEHLENAVRLAKPDDPKPRAALDAWKGKAPSP